MPWRETCRMDEKLDFVLAWHRGEAPMTALCAAYGISRKTGYKWLGRYREAGPGGLAERSCGDVGGRRGVTAGRWRLGLRRRLWSCAGRIRSGVPGSFARF